jgi:hypothetical protein
MAFHILEVVFGLAQSALVSEVCQKLNAEIEHWFRRYPVAGSHRGEKPSASDSGKNLSAPVCS